MVSDPDTQADNTTAAPVTDAAAAAAAGFTAAAASTAAADTVAETADSKSWSRQFKDSCDKLWEQMKNRVQGRKSFASTDADLPDSYKHLWFRKALGHQVFDCGDCFHMSGTRDKPVTDKQICNMVLAAINRKDPPWETLYMWNHKGNPDPAMGARVQNVINGMRQQGMIPPTCKIHVSLEYPCANIRDFSRHLKSLFGQAAHNGAQQQEPEAPRAGIHAHQRAGLHAV